MTRLLERMRRAFAGPDIDADGWYTRGTAPVAAPEYDPTWADDDICRPASDDVSPLDDPAWVALDRARRNDRLGVALPCGRWRRASEHDAHTWDHDGTVAQCPGWRGAP